MDEVHIVDDDAAVRESLKFLLATSGFPARVYASAEAFLERLPEIDGCVITDVRMPGLSGIELLEAVRESGSDIAVVVVTGHGDVAMAVEAMKLGAIDFLEKPFEESRIIDAVETACARHKAASNAALQLNEVRERLDSLSKREREVLAGLVNGRQNKEIALDLGISPRTVEVYRANVMTKMQAGSLSELVRISLLAPDAIPPVAPS